MPKQNEIQPDKSEKKNENVRVRARLCARDIHHILFQRITFTLHRFIDLKSNLSSQFYNFQKRQATLFRVVFHFLFRFKYHHYAPFLNFGSIFL